jgi:hypothetical protein
MKKIFATVLFLGTVLHLAPAPAAADTIFGLLLGVNLGKIGGLMASDWSFRPGLLGGAYLNFPLGKVFSFEPELYFTQKGAEQQQDIGMGVVTTTIALSYIEVPLLFKIAIPLGEDYISRPRIYAGPTVAYNIRRVLKLRYEDPTGNDDSVVPFTDIKKFEAGFVVGAGMEFDVKGGLFTLDARYSWSLQTITTTPPDKTNRVLAVVIGFGFK